MSDPLPPPWLQHPEISRYSADWQTGDGESYLLDWWTWFEDLDTNTRIEYFRQYKPLPMEWLDWIAAQFGFDAGADAFDSNLSLEGIRWLDKQGLADFAAFQQWHDDYQVKSSGAPDGSSD